MNKINAKLTAFVAMMLFFSLSAKAQHGWEVGAGAGVAYYFGDLNTNFRLDKPGLSGTVFARYDFNPRINTKIGIGYGHLQAYDEDSENIFERNRNLSFRSNIYEITGQFEFNFFKYVHGSRDNFYTPYLFGGLTVFNFNPQAELDGTVYNLREYGTEGQFSGEEYYTTTMAAAYGIGFKVDLSFEWSLNLEISARKLFMDYLDDVSTVYADAGDLEALRGPIAPLLADRSLSDVNIGSPGRQRGDSNGNDTYVLTNISLVYYFGSVQCPTISKYH
ncbi:MAG TPA: hypothetical protein ENK85_02055 [Saprospiraceae bacterium]|nr:hypothetical protein [Saprospiraceae bacterium]